MDLDEAMHRLKVRANLDKHIAIKQRPPFLDEDLEALDIVLESLEAFVDALARSEATTVREKP